MRTLTLSASALACTLPLVPAIGQSLDRVDPDIIRQERPPAPEAERDPGGAPDTMIAQPAAGPVSGGDVLVGAIRIEGGTVLRPADFAHAIAPFLGQRLDLAGQQRLVEAVVDVARARGFVLATATIPPQSLQAGVLSVRVDEGRVEAVRTLGTRHRRVERTLAPLAGGRPLTRPELERRLLLARSLPGVRLRDVRLVQEGGLNILQVHVTEDRVAGSAVLDNWGTRAIGPLTLQGQGRVRSVAASGDELVVVATGIPLQPGEFMLAGLRYAVPVGDDGTRARGSVTVARSEPGGRLERFDTIGDSVRAGFELRHPLVRRASRSLFATVELAHRSVEQEQRASIVRQDRVTSVAGRLNGWIDLPDGRAVADVRVTQGLDLLSATRRGDPLASRGDGDGVFTLAEARISLTHALTGPFSFALAGQAQLASRPLLSGDEMGLGGPRFGRGYDFRERSGDNGAAASAELRLAAADRLGPLRAVQVYGFGDAGRVWNLEGGRRGGDLYSAGGGIRAVIARRFEVGVEAGFPIGDDRIESGDRSPRLSFETFWRL